MASDPSNVELTEQSRVQSAPDARNDFNGAPVNAQNPRPHSGRNRAQFHAYRHQNPDAGYHNAYYRFPHHQHQMFRGGMAAGNVGYWQYNQGYAYGQGQQYYPMNNYYDNYYAPAFRPSNRHRGPRPHHQHQHQNQTRTRHLQSRFRNPNSGIAAETQGSAATNQPMDEGASITQENVTQNAELTNENAANNTSIAAAAGASNEGAVKATSRVFTPVNKTVLAFDTASESELNRLCEIERNQLKRRFRLSDTLFIDYDGVSGDDQKEQKTGRELYTVIVAASDPDWPFDVRSVTLNVDFPVNYPREPMKIVVAEKQRLIASRSKDTSEELVFPDVVRRVIQQRVEDYVATKWSQMQADNRIDLQFRTFLHWFDRELLNMFITGLRSQRLVLSAQAAGISVGHTGKWRGKDDVQERRVTEPSEKSEGEVLSSKLEELELRDDVSGGSSEAEYESDSEEGEEPASGTAPTQGGKVEQSIPAGSSIEIELTHLEFREQAASLRCTSLCIEFACSRCRTAVTLPLPCGASRSAPLVKSSGVGKKCIRCRTDFSVSFHSAIAHGTSNVVGQLVGVSNLLPNDVLVVQSRFELQCLMCGHNTALTEARYGMNEARCMKCFAQVRVSFDSSRFYAVSTGGRQLIARSNLRRVALNDSLTQPGRLERQKEPTRAVGTPLPNFGTCRHYAKSYRWFRFSCCGKLYPCDECHREVEKSHEEQLASRMVCGYCSAEQPINPNAVCTHCLADLRRGSSRSAHWEGGQGCRDVIRMARSDAKKYSNQNKTESKHAVHNRQQQRRSGRNPPKDTKLRHAADKS